MASKILKVVLCVMWDGVILEFGEIIIIKILANIYSYFKII